MSQQPFVMGYRTLMLSRLILLFKNLGEDIILKSPMTPLKCQCISPTPGLSQAELGNKYDLIVFSSLDSHTVFSSFSSLRLDNYVYTLQSFELARNLLNPNGTMVLIFTGRDFVNRRLAATLVRVFGTPPSAFLVGQDGVFSSIVYVEGLGLKHTVRLPYSDIGAMLIRPDTVLATDSWPFLYLTHRTIPESLFVTLLFLILAAHALLKSSLERRMDQKSGVSSSLSSRRRIYALRDKGSYRAVTAIRIYM